MNPPPPQRITPDTAALLYDSAATRLLEYGALAALPPHTLMQRAGLAVARLASALAPHAHGIWLACGPGNNGGDGLEAAMHLQRWGRKPVVTWLGTPDTAPAEARAAWQRAAAAGVRFADQPPGDLGPADLCVDALLGLGSTRAPSGALAAWVTRMNAGTTPVLAVDLPTGLHPDTGNLHQPRTANATEIIANNDHSMRTHDVFDSNSPRAVRASHTLSLLTLKPGLFTALGRDLAGQVWLDTLGVPATLPASARLPGRPQPQPWRHAYHKGARGDVAVIGGAAGMRGAALLAGSAALHGGAGRVWVALLDSTALALDPLQPELMLRAPGNLDLAHLTGVCGCGGGPAIAPLLPRVLCEAARLVLDADALNAVATHSELKAQLRERAGRRQPTVLTPHPLEAARLLGCTTAEVQAQRLGAARQLAHDLQCAVVLKGSGSIIAAPDQTPIINPTGNGRLATAGTGDVLAGLIGARLAAAAAGPDAAFHAAWTGAYLHGDVADHWPAHPALTAGALARALG